MRIPLTRFGMPQVAVYPIGLIVLMLVCFLVFRAVIPLWAMITVELVLVLVLIWALSFFRDPQRDCPDDPDLLLAPADGMVTDIEFVQEDSFIKGKALRIGIFLSIFNVHINRAPCAVKVDGTKYYPGKYKNALNPESSRVNEANAIHCIRTCLPHDKLIVRQISGAIARRIVCRVSKGTQLRAGEQVGMIKFGSRTELYVAARENLVCQVKKGDKVRAGLTIMARYNHE